MVVSTSIDGAGKLLERRPPATATRVSLPGGSRAM